MSNLYKITPSNEGQIKLSRKISEDWSFQNPMPPERAVKIIETYQSGYAFRNINEPVLQTEIDSDSGVVCNQDTGPAVLDTKFGSVEFEYIGLWEQFQKDFFEDHWKFGWDGDVAPDQEDATWGEGLVGLEWFLSIPGRPVWKLTESNVHILGDVTIDKVEGPLYTNVIESNVQPL
jgi:hypothetical protein